MTVEEEQLDEVEALMILDARLSDALEFFHLKFPKDAPSADMMARLLIVTWMIIADELHDILNEDE